MPLCKYKYCLNLSNEDEYQRLYLEENPYYSEVEYSYEENLREEENERSFMKTSDNDEENERSYMEMSDSEDLEETDDDFGFENEENNNYENDLIFDSQNESEFDNANNVNFNTDNEEDSMIISDELLERLRLLYVKSNFNFSEAAFNNIYKVFNRNKMSFNKIKKILGSIVGIEPKIYDMCVNLCCAFVGVLENERKCKFCKEDRYYSNGKSRKNLPFISIIEHLKLQFKNSKRSEELLYRYNYTNNIGELVHGNIGDIFDGQIYKELLDDGYFPDSRDIAFTASCDGPKQPQDFNLFLYPLIQEMKMLQGKFYPKNNERNSNNYTISSKTWVEIGEIMKKNRSNMSSDIGRPSRNIVKHSAGFKAVEWANWIILFSLPLLKGRLPQSSYGLEDERLPVYLISFHYLLHIGDCIEDLGPYHGFWQFPMERYCGMLIPLVSSRKLPYVNLFNNVLLQERFKYLQLLPKYDKKVFSNFKEKEKTWPPHRVISSDVYDRMYEFYSPCISCKLTKNETMKLKQCYAAIFQNTRDIRDIEESYINSQNDYYAAQEEEIFGQIEYFMIHMFQGQERMFAYIRKIKKLEKSIGNLKFFDVFGPLQYVKVIGIDRTVGFFEVYDKKKYYIIDKYANW
ncbi:hypothetical protein GLOIN_2v1812804 [Rhizophagus clarus]|uniref:Transposase domain-containing protein n=1 Tax=Rhizophagus clarus TaxID=94130 RepID=A0A8H3QAM6_9GLOM|nr:hypothetical protein GLOIN_2v1812804 [Rhizophagus clarus]